MLTTSQIIVNTLKKCRVKQIFGTPGTSEIPFLSALEEDGSIKYITAYLDGLAVGMADGYARSSGNVGIANLHATQGTLNAIGFIRVALRDHSPIVVISGLPSHSYELVEPNHFVYGLTDILRRVTKWSWQVNSKDQVAWALERAIKISLTPPYGPTFVGIPQDIQVEKTNNIDYPLHNSNFLKIHTDNNELNNVAKEILKAKNPVIFAGRKLGISKSQKELSDIADKLGILVISEAPDRGPQVYTVNLPSNHPYYLGYYSNTDDVIKSVISKSDIIIDIGCKTTYKRVVAEINIQKTKIIQIDDDPLHLGKYYAPQYGIYGDIKSNLNSLLKCLLNNSVRYKEEIDRRKKEYQLLTKKHRKIITKEVESIEFTGNKISPIQLVKAMQKSLPDGCCIYR